MRWTYILPLLAFVLAGLDLPDAGPIPADKPPRAAIPSGATPMPEAITAPGSGADDKEPSASHGIESPTDTEEDLARCETALRRHGATFKRAAPIAGDNGCGIGAPYAITEISKGVKLAPASQLRCSTALALARWVEAVVLPSASALPGEVRLSKITHGSTYVCRRRNNGAAGKMSEHAIGNAIDITGFEFEGRSPLAISPRAGRGTIEEAFQRTVRAGACLHFTTVLGPGSDSSHDDHLHLDIAERRGGYRLCQ